MKYLILRSRISNTSYLFIQKNIPAMIKQLFLTFTIFTFFTISAFSQAQLIQEDCWTLTASLEGATTAPKTSSDVYSFVLEKEVLPNLWRKIQVLETPKTSVQFKNLPAATYRVTVISPEYFTNKKTQMHHRLGETETPKLANTFLSNTVALEPYVDCETIQQIATTPTALKQQSSLRLYPNPTQDKLWVEWNGAKELKTLAIYSLTGTLLLEITPTTKITEIDLSQMKPGIYFVKATDATSTIATERVSVIR